MRASLLCFPLVLLSSAAFGQVVASLGNVQITAPELQRIVAALPPDLRADVTASPQALDRLVRTELVRRALFAEARTKGWDKRPEVAERAERAAQQAVVSSYINDLARPPADYPTDAEITAFYEANKERFVKPRELRLAQIYLRRPADAALADAVAKRAGALAQQARAAGADFAELAKKSSEHAESAAKGGDLGWLSEGAIVPEVRKVVQQLPPGSVTDPVATAEGWHIVRVQEVRPAAPAPLAEVRDEIRNALRFRRAQELEAKYLDDLLARTPPTLNEAELQKVRQGAR
jgi:peptidylprolyl isomerase